MDRKTDFEKKSRRLMGDIRVGLDDEYSKKFERRGFFTEAWKRRLVRFATRWRHTC